MKYYLHDSNSFNDEKVSELFINFGYEGLGVFYTFLEKLAAQEKPLKTNVLKSQLKVGKKLNKCWSFMEEIELISSNNGETFNKQLLNFSGKYAIKKEKNAKRISEWREKQTFTENVTHSEQICNNDKVKESKVNVIKEEEPPFLENTINFQLETKEGITTEIFNLETEKEKKKKSCAKKVIPEITQEIADLLSICTAKFNEKYVNDKTIAMFAKLLKSYSKEQIKQAIENGTKDDFWRMNFLSPSKLADKDKNGVYYIDKFINLKPNGANWSNNKTKQPEHLHNGGKFTTAVTKENF